MQPWLTEHPVLGMPIGNGNTVGKSIYHNFLPQALKSGQFKPLPLLDVIEEGLDKIQGGMDRLKADGFSKEACC